MQTTSAANSKKMADLVNKTLGVVSSLPLRSLEEEWVKTCWDAHFLDSTPLPLATEDLLQDSGYCVEDLQRLQEIAREWKDVDSETEGLWTVLLENDVSHKALVALLAYLMPMDHGIRTLRGQKREAAFVAATVYLSLIGLPGSRAFKIYSPDLLLRAADVLKNGVCSGSASQKRGAPSVTSSQKSQSQSQSRKRRRGGTQSSQPLSQTSLEEDDINDDEEDDELSPSQLAHLRSLYLDLLVEMVCLLEKFSLRESMMTRDHVLKVLASLARQDNDLFDGKFPVTGSNKRLSTAGLAYKGLFLLCQPLHGDVQNLTTTICKYLLPHVLMLLEGNKVCTNTSLPQFLQLGREHAIGFVRFLLKESDQVCLVSVKILVQHLCMKAPDRAEYRAKAAQAVVKIVQDFPDEQYAFMLKWIGVLSRNEKSSVRTFALEVTTLLLMVPERTLTGVPADLAALASHVVLVNQLLARCSDVAAAVRTKAITGFAQCLEEGCMSVCNAIQEMITPRSTTQDNRPRLTPTPETARTAEPADRTVNETDQASTHRNQPDATGDATDTRQGDATPGTPAGRTPAGHTPGSDKPQTPFCSVEITEALNNSLPDRAGIVSMLHKRTREEKVFVRKAALQALHKFILFEAPAFRQEDIDVLCERCRDKALTVRKQSLVSLTEVLLQFQTNPCIQKGWLKGVLPMVWDQETSIQDKCLEIIEQVIISNIVPAVRSKSGQHTLAWQLLKLISLEENSDLRRHMKKACRLLEQRKRLEKSTVSSLLSHVGTDNNQAAWSLLADFASTKLTIDTKPVVQHWDTHSHTITGTTGGEVWENVLKIIGANAKNISADQQTHLIADFKSQLLRFELQSVLISALATTIHQLSHAQHGDNFKQCQKWGQEILVACDEYLSTIVLEEDGSSEREVDENTVTCYLYTLGVVALLCPTVTPKRAPMLVQSFIATLCIAAPGDSSDEISTGSQPSQPSQQSQGAEVSSERTTQGTQSSQAITPLSQFRGSKMSDRIRAVAFLTLGKLCLQEKSLAKKCVPAMARELEVSASDSVRNNIIIILRDLCIRYTTLVDPYVANMASCLRDPAPIVRIQTLELLTGLLQEDFLKWKGVMFFRFILTLLDPHPGIRELAEFCLGYHLLKRRPTLMSQHLLESIFVFNDYQKHAVFNKYTQSDRERELFCLKGKENKENRLKLYQFMLEHMEDEHRFQLTAKISQEVLGAFVDGILPFDSDSHDLLQDALAILSSKEIKLSSLRNTRTVEDASDEMEMANAVMATARKTLITQVVKKNVMENIIPVVLSLKHMMEKERSPLLGDLMAFLRELVKDYKNEVKEILAADKQLACEVEYDLRLFEKQQAEGTGQGQNTPVTTGAVQPAEPGSATGSRPMTPVAARPQTPATGAKNSKSATPASSSANQSGARDIVLPQPSPKPRSHEEVASAIRQATMQKLEQLKERRKSEQNGRRLSTVRWAENTVINSSAASKDLQESAEEGNQPRTPVHRTPVRPPLRAISTPSGALGNVTFAGENMTLPLVPPSPIPGQSRSKAELGDVEEEMNVVFMDSLEDVQPQPRKWKVKMKNQEQAVASSQPAAIASPIVNRNRRARRN